MVFCYIVVIDGYVIEGYVLVVDICRFFEECLDIVGFVVLGMFYGLFGMGFEDDCEVYDVFFICEDGLMEVFLSYVEG